jgi:glycogen operon protein
LDNLAWYLHDGSSPARYADVTGTGNSLDFRRADVVTMALDSLRHWARDYQVDGFRYDLAVTLGRSPTGFTRDHPFFIGLRTDPELRGLKHIAEPWDLGPGGWQTGSFPVPMAAWNDHFRDDARSFWLLNPRSQSHGWGGVSARDLATRLSGSADLFGSGDPQWNHGPDGSVNYVTAHDGFTLADLVSYEHKHNEANGEDNRDGTDDNRSWNHGFEGRFRAQDGAGPHGAGIGVDAMASLRRRSQRNLLATLAFAAGVPMLTAGDEMGRTQSGNNNAYCQDAPLSWLGWDLEATPWKADLVASAARLFQLRRDNPALRPDRFASGAPAAPGGPADLAWFDPEGRPVTHEQWNDPDFRAVQMARSAEGLGGASALLILNASLDPIECVIPELGQAYRKTWDSSWETPGEPPDPESEGPDTVAAGARVPVEALTVRLYLALP